MDEAIVAYQTKCWSIIGKTSDADGGFPAFVWDKHGGCMEGEANRRHLVN